jgi:hypothetical protein
LRRFGVLAGVSSNQLWEVRGHRPDVTRHTSHVTRHTSCATRDTWGSPNENSACGLKNKFKNRFINIFTMPLQSHFKTSLKYLDEVLHLFTDQNVTIFQCGMRLDTRTLKNLPTRPCTFPKCHNFAGNTKVQRIIIDTKTNAKFQCGNQVSQYSTA